MNASEERQPITATADSVAVHLWFTRPELISDPDVLASYEAVLSEDEKARWRRFVFPRHRHQFLVTRALVRSTLSRYHTTAPAMWRFVQNEHEKPEISEPDDCGLQFNLSHTEGFVACAVTPESPVGVDVENVGRAVDCLGVGRRFFSPAEFSELERTGDSRLQLFHRYWTMKEAYIKACGAGMAIPLDSFSFTFRSAGQPQVRFEESREDDPAEWQFDSFLLLEQFRIGLAVRTRKGLRLEIRETIPDVR